MGMFDQPAGMFNAAPSPIGDMIMNYLRSMGAALTMGPPPGALDQLYQKVGDIGTGAAGLAERFNLGAANLLDPNVWTGQREPRQGTLPVAPGLQAVGDALTFATGGLQSSLFPAPGMLREGARYAGSLAGDAVGDVLPRLLADEAGGTYRAYKGYFPYDWRTMPVKDWRGNIIEGADRVPQPITEFKSPNTPGTAGWFTDSPQVASRFANAYSEHGAVYPANVTLDNPAIIDAAGHSSSALQFEDIANKAGTTDLLKQFLAAIGNPKNDGVILKNTADEGTVYIPRAASQIRSIFEGPPPIRAFHGSPYDFDKFDISKIGTGEGAQAYGHGLYFAENEGVARAYRDALAIPKFDDQIGNAADLVKRFGGEAEALTQLRSALARNPKLQVEIDAITSGAYKDWKPPGRMYEVNLHADPDAFLNWDKPLSGQPQAVQKALPDFVEREAAYKARYPSSPLGDPFGSNIYESSLLVPGEFRDRLAASAALQERGIPGIKYLDQGSRFHPASLPDNPIANEAREFLKMANGDSAAALQAFKDSNPISRWAGPERDEIRKVIESAGRQQTSNYVVFDPSIIEILRKYGILGPVAMPGALMPFMGDQQQ